MLINKISASELSRKFIRSALLVGHMSIVGRKSAPCSVASVLLASLRTLFPFSTASAARCEYPLISASCASTRFCCSSALDGFFFFQIVTTLTDIFSDEPADDVFELGPLVLSLSEQVPVFRHEPVGLVPDPVGLPADLVGLVLHALVVRRGNLNGGKDQARAFFFFFSLQCIKRPP